jgi:hypothetical protein
LAGTRVFFHKIDLVADKHDLDLLLGRVEKRLQPVFNVLESLAVRDVVHDEATEGFSVVCDGDGPVFLLARCVPQLRLDCCSILHAHVLGGELDPNCVSDFLRQCILQVAA